MPSARLALSVLLSACVLSADTFASDASIVTIRYAEQQHERAPSLSNLKPRPSDLGLAGARL